MTQQVTSGRFPYLPIRLEIVVNRTTGEETQIELEALLDTGFDGDVVVPAAFQRREHFPLATTILILADGSEIEAPTYRGRLSIGGLGPVSVLVTALGSEPMVGRNVLRFFTVTLDHNRRVTVEP